MSGINYAVNITTIENTDRSSVYSGSVTYPMHVVKTFDAIFDNTIDAWLVLDSKGKPHNGATTAHIIEHLNMLT